MITGLPRSGSTLLSSILKQNPRFHASITDSLAPLTRGVADNCQEGPGMKTEVPLRRRENLIRYLFEGFYADVDKPVIFNTNRGWTYLTPLVRHVFPESKMILCVRDIAWIVDSFESAHRRNPLSTNTIFGGHSSGSVYDRANLIMEESNGVVGWPYVGIKQAITGNEKDMLMIVEYEQLCSNPEGMMRAIYNFIGEQYYEHDFNNVESSWDEYDMEIGIDLHTTRKKVEFKQRDMILPPDLRQRFNGMEVWRY